MPIFWRYETSSGNNICIGMEEAPSKPSDPEDDNRTNSTNESWSSADPTIVSGERDLVPAKTYDPAANEIRLATSTETKNAKLREEKIKRMKEVDAKTGALFDKGFTFDGKEFMLDLDDSLNFLTLYVIRDTPAVRYPVTIQLKDYGEYQLADSADVELLFLASVTRAMTILFGSRQLKTSIKAATTEAGLAAIADTRE